MKTQPTPQPVHDERQALDEEANRATANTRLGEGALIRVLVRVEAMRLFDDYGYSSLYAYCTKRLKMSEREACLRVSAVRKVREVPEVLFALEDGRLTLTNLSEMKGVLRAENAQEVIDLFTHKSKLQTQELVATMQPKPPQKSQIRKMPTPHANGQPQHVQTITPHAEDLYKFIAMITGMLFAKIQQAFDVTKRENPNSDPAVFLEHATDLVIAEAMKKLLGSENPDKPCETQPPKNPEDISKATKRAVWKRDGGQCAFVGKLGGRCTERAGLEFDHITPRARGGKGTVENTRLLCGAHHTHVTVKTFGRAFIDEKIALRKEQKTVKAAADGMQPPTATNVTPVKAGRTQSKSLKKAALPTPASVKKAAPRGDGGVAAAKKTVAAKTTAPSTGKSGG